MSTTGTVLAAYGRQFLVRDRDTAEDLPALARGRELDIAVGDEVGITVAGKGQRVITTVAPRRSALLRSAAHRSKMLAANIDQVAIVIAPVPHYSEDIVLRISIAATAATLPVIIVANKADHPQFAAIERRLQVFSTLDMQVVSLSARQTPEQARAQLAPLLAARCTLLCGESGMGKSTLLNVLVPDAEQRTNDISVALDSGRHTTTSSRLFDLDPTFTPDATVIDSPGFQQFGLAHLSPSQCEHAMPDFKGLLGNCRFHNCRHDSEPGCAIRAGVEAGRVDSLRYRLFMALAS